jgi:hypothetical protein
MTTLPMEEARAGWDEIAAGYDRTNTPTQMWWRTKASGGRASVRVCGSWTWRPGAVP